VQEIVDLRFGDVRLLNPAVVRLTGKGSKVRSVPLLKGNVQILSTYVHDNQRRLLHKDDVLFVNHSGQGMTRAGISYILRKNADAARLLHPELIPEKLTPHCLRHSKAMHLLQAGVNLIYIRDFLGHSDVKTTQIYARADVTLKRQAIEAANVVEIHSDLRSWTEDADLIMVGYGTMSRACRAAVIKARKQGLKLGLIQVKTIWPFPKKAFLNIKTKAFLAVEMSIITQMGEDVALAARGIAPVYTYATGGVYPSIDMIINKCKDALCGKVKEV